MTLHFLQFLSFNLRSFLGWGLHSAAACIRNNTVNLLAQGNQIDPNVIVTKKTVAIEFRNVLTRWSSCIFSSRNALGMCLLEIMFIDAVYQ